MKRLIFVTCLTVIVFLPIFPNLAFAQLEHKIVAYDGTGGDWFGNSVALSGRNAIVGAFRSDANGANSGAAYIYRRSGIGWSRGIKLVASNGAAGDEFGGSVSISGYYVVVGAKLHNGVGPNSGAAYVFKRTDTGWIEDAILTANDAASYNWFGCAVAISGDYIVVGSNRNNAQGANSGAAYVFKRDGNAWLQVTKLVPMDGAADDEFGASVAISGTHIVVGAPKDDDLNSNSGSIYVYKFENNAWIHEIKFNASDGARDDFFGSAVSIDRNNIVVGAYGDDDKGSESGSVYIYNLLETGWSEAGKLTAGDGTMADYFGFSVAVNSSFIVVGAYGDDDVAAKAGSAYVFRYNGDEWLQTTKMYASDASSYDWFGYSVAVNSGIAMCGAARDDDFGGSSGSAYVKFINSPPFLSSVADVPNDEGGYVTVTWEASPLDNGIDTLAFYSVWRALPDQKRRNIDDVSMKAITKDFKGSAHRLQAINSKQMLWEWLANQPAHFYPNYTYTAKTLYDSSSLTDGKHYFLVSAHTINPNIYFDSNVDSGYSVDNIAPTKPLGLYVSVIGNTVELSWEESLERDFRYYRLYRDEAILDSTAHNYYRDTTVKIGYSYTYVVSSVDIHGNESEFSEPATSGIVPVELATFKATFANGTVILEWQTASETSNYGFAIQRKTGTNFEEKADDWREIGFVAGRGTTSEPQNYQFIDNQIDGSPRVLSYQYRLKQIDTDGSFSLLQTVTVVLNQPDDFQLLQNYPNPFNAQTVVRYQLPVAARVELVIYNETGQKVRSFVYQQQNAGNYQINWDGTDAGGIQVPSGVYLYKLTAGDYVQTKRMILLK